MTAISFGHQQRRTPSDSQCIPCDLIKRTGAVPSALEPGEIDLRQIPANSHCNLRQCRQEMTPQSPLRVVQCPKVQYNLQLYDDI